MASILCHSCGAEGTLEALFCMRCGARQPQRDELNTPAGGQGRDPMLGQRVLEYRIEGKLGVGGMGTVYRAKHEVLGQEVAIKVINPVLARDPELVERFIQEARIQVSLRHPNIVNVLTAVTTGPHMALIMDFVDGLTLSQVLDRRKRLPVPEALRFFQQVLDAVGYAHSRGVVHRDLKPGNLMIQADGTAKVMDFGIAKLLGGGKLTQTGTALGSANYMAPEQILGRNDLDQRVDVYALGVTIFETLVGQLPFEAEGPRGSSSDFLIKQAHVQQPAPDPRSIRPDIPENIARAVLKALSKEPAQRFSSCAEFSSALGRMQGMPAALDSREPLAMHMAGPDNSPEATRRVSRENELRAAAREGIRREAAPMSDAPSPKTPPGPAIESLRSDTPKGPETVELATIRIRFWAYFIDIILIVMVLIFLMVLITKRSGDMNEPGQSSVIAAIYLILISFYEFLFLTIGGRTPGKKLMGIKVVTMNGDELSAGRAAVRVLVRSGLAFAWEGILAIVNYLFAFGESRRCIHDWAAGTQVIKKR